MMFETGNIVCFTNTNEFCEIKDICFKNIIYELKFYPSGVPYSTSINNPYLRIATKQERHSYLLRKFNNSVEN